MTRFLVILVVVLILTDACGPRKAEEQSTLDNLPQETTNLTDEQLAKAYCGSCHLYTDPSLLDKKTWENKVLPEMGKRMGVIDDNFTLYGSMSQEELNIVLKEKVFLDKPLVGEKDWQRLVAYYIKNAPEQIAAQEHKAPVSSKLSSFEVVIPKFAKNSPTNTTMLKFNPMSKQLWVGQRSGKGYLIDKTLTAVDSVNFGDTPSDVTFMPDGSLWALLMGVMDPSDKREGKLVQFSGAKWSERKVLAQQLPRPVQLSVANLTGDEKSEAIIAGYGNYTGHLTWFLFPARDREVPHILKNVSGAIRTIAQDFDNDGDTDIMALFAQGNEQIVLYTNEGREQFTEKQLLQFSPVYGSSYFELADFNQDGHLDILYTNGDNADYSPILKPYHGVRIFLNDGKFNFKQAFFFPIHGAFKSIADDFDQDGDLDIASIAYFPDEENGAKESFVYLENKGNLRYEAATFPQADVGRWLVMEKGDFDQDGDVDIALGSFIHERTIGGSAYRQRQWRSGIHVLILKNKKK